MRARCRVVLTRTAEDNGRMRAALGGIAAEVVDYPCIAIEGIEVPTDVLEKLHRNTYSAAIFVSRNAAEHFFSSSRGSPPNEVVAIGPSTAQALSRHGWSSSAMPSAANVASAIEELDQLIRSPGPVLYIRGDLGEDTLPEALRKAGKAVDVVVVYRTRQVDSDPLLRDERPTLLTFASPSAVQHFKERNAEVNATALAIGETTAAAARAHGFDVVVAPSPDIDGMAAAIRGWLAGQP